jgi:4,5-DOPA dioxygenase extradiol
MTLPTLFLSHGAPDLLTSEAPARHFLENLADQLPAPRFIALISAHWCTQRPSVDVSARPATIHDFVGFGVELDRLSYPARGAPDDARRAVELIRAAGMECNERERGLDHGAWVPLSLIWPRADIPVFQVALSPGMGIEHHFELGRALAPLAADGGLVVGTGGAVHNLSEMGEVEAPWAARFEEWLVAAAEAGDEAALRAYRTKAPDAQLAHPTPEHLLPLFVALAAAGDGAKGRTLHKSWTHGTLSMASFAFSPAGTAAR